LFDVDLTHRFANDLYFGGDYYDIFSLGNEEYMFMLGDVAGHGLKASFFTAILKSIIFSEYIKNNDSISPALFLEWLNKRLFPVLKNTPDLFIAFSASLFKAKEKKLIFANAGQPPFMICSNGILSRHANPEIAIGADEDVVFSETEVLVSPGDLVLMCTDGLYPAGKPDTTVGMDDFDRLIKSNYRSGDFNRILMDAVNEKGKLSEDDSTLMSIRIK
jgi:sigma-B regulation protein RsbU (phosphoserine phosphatase)